MTPLAAPHLSLFRRSAFGLAAVAATFLSACASMSNTSQKGGPDVGLYELRTYTASPGKMAALDARFRDHTIKLLAKHGVSNWLYLHRMADQPEADVNLTYFVTHASEAAAKASFSAFGADPAWKAAREASEKAAGGSLTVNGGVKSVFLAATDYSPTR